MHGFVTAGGRCPNLTTASARSVCVSLSAFFIVVVVDDDDYDDDDDDDDLLQVGYIFAFVYLSATIRLTQKFFDEF